MGKWVGKKIFLLVIGIFLVFALAGCGFRGTLGRQNPQIEEKTKIRIAWWGLEGRHENMQKILKLYEGEHAEIAFEVMPMGWDGYFDWLSVQAASG